MRFRPTVCLLAVALSSCLLNSPLSAEHVAIVLDKKVALPAEHGIGKLQKQLVDLGHTVTRSVAVRGQKNADFFLIAGLASGEGEAATILRREGIALPKGSEAIVVHRTRIHGKPTVVLCGSDDRALMYAALDTSQRLSWAERNNPSGNTNAFEHIVEISEKPFVAERAVSTYTMHQKHFEDRLYDEEYWTRYFDMLAESRINSFVIVFGYENGGFMAPVYPYFFDMEEYPDVRLVGITPEKQARNSAAFQRMIEIAHARGVDITAAIWDHIYRGGVQGGGIAGASDSVGQRVAGLVYGVHSDNLTSYNKLAISRFLDRFPELDGLQFRMHGESGLRRDEMAGFWHEVFAMIREKHPEMRIDLRAKQLPDAIIRDGLDQGLSVRVATKYWMEQMGMPFHPTHVNRGNQHDRRHGYADLLKYPRDYKVHWRMWNGGTTRFLLWGDPEYVRQFAASTHVGGGNSFEVNEMLATKMLGEPHADEVLELLNPDYRYYDYEFERYWHYYQLWGRVSYNPETSTEIWDRRFVRKFGDKAGPHLQQGLHLASQVLPRIVAASYNYSMFPTTRGWAEMMRVYDLPRYASGEGSDIQQFMNVRDEALSRIKGTDTAMRRPTETSRWFGEIAAEIRQHVATAEQNTGNQPSREFVSTVCDLKILAALAQYHSHRLIAGIHYNLFKQTADLFAMDDAIRAEQDALAAWKQIVEAAGDVYSKQLAFGVHRVGFSRHWEEEGEKLEQGLVELREERRKAVQQAAKADVGIAHVPVRRIRPGEPLVIRATVLGSDRPSVVSLQVIEENGRSRTIAMHSSEATPNMYQAAIKPGIKEGKLKYRILVGNRSIGETSDSALDDEMKLVTVDVTSDREPPSVEIDSKKRAAPGENFLVTARVTDSSAIRSVRLRYRHLTQYEDYRSVDMKLDPATGRFGAEIPGDFIDADWDIMFFVEAIDQKGNGRMYPDLASEMPYVIIPTQ